MGIEGLMIFVWLLGWGYTAGVLIASGSDRELPASWIALACICALPAWPVVLGFLYGNE